MSLLRRKWIFIIVGLVSIWIVVFASVHLHNSRRRDALSAKAVALHARTVTLHARAAKLKTKYVDLRETLPAKMRVNSPEYQKFQGNLRALTDEIGTIGKETRVIQEKLNVLVGEVQALKTEKQTIVVQLETILIELKTIIAELEILKNPSDIE